jgi:hypothetical protein
LLALQNASRSRRDGAWAELVDLVNHQGTIYEATVATVSALLTDAVRLTIPAMEVLAFVAGPAEYIECPGELGANLRRALVEGHPLYVATLRSEDAAEREVAAFILGNLPERRADSLPELEELIAGEQAPAPLAVAIWALGTLQTSPKMEFFTRLARQMKAALPRAVASAFLARWHGREASESETRAIVDALHDRLDQNTRLPFGFLEDSLQSPLGGELLQQVRTGRYVRSS